ncbi:MAG: DUF3052 family protein [Bryobacterales bacterium]|nr:DUF3052 family protein [Bryobacterales bacterium]
MGREALCSASWRGEEGRGKALLETASVVFRGDFRFDLPFHEIKLVEVDEGRLRLTVADSIAVLDLGAEAAKWADKILHPPTLLEKLGVKPGMSIYAEGVNGIGTSERGKNHDLIFFGAETAAALKRLRVLARWIKQDGAVWVVYPKGVKIIRESEVMAASKEAGLVDVKVASFSATHTALKLVIPVVKRVKR